MGPLAARPRRWTRRSVLALFAGSGLAVERGKGALFSSEFERFPDPATELEVYRLTSPEYAAHLPAYYNRALSRRGQFLICWSDRTGSPQAYRIHLKSGEWLQLTDATALDGSTVTLMPDERSFCYFDGAALKRVDFAKFREREIYRVPDGWKRCPGASLTDDGLYAIFAECRKDASRLRLVSMAKGTAATIAEAPWVISDPMGRPRRTQVLYRQESGGLWLVNFDGQQNRKLKIAPGPVGPARWAPDGRTVLYLYFPEEKTQLNTIREHTPDANQDQLVAKTSQFVHFDANRDTSVFVGASRNKASPHILILLRTTGRELTLCEHRASDPSAVAPIFSADSQQIFFQSDKQGKTAIYRVHIARFVEATEDEL
ncbi:MAG: oligogalacturonate lyase family protein [Acidobacteriia bacterium]|nr:oligogalacturonate lyase family protein [Terriglobia bacterium]